MKTITRKVFSVCDTFIEEHEELYDSLTSETSPDCYIEYRLNKENKTPTDEITEVLVKNGASYGEKVLIEIDY